MNVTIYPSRFILDKNFLGSKDLTQRYLIASWLANEPIILDNIADNEDVESTLNFFKALKKEVIYTSFPQLLQYFPIIGAPQLLQYFVFIS